MSGQAAAKERSDRAPEGGPSSAGALRRVALLGSGYIADWHAGALASVPGVQLVAVCDRVLPRARALAGKFGIPGVYGALDTMLSAERLDAVHVLLPPDLHHAAARQVLEAGVNAFLEKPMCTRVEDAEDLVRLAAARGLSLGVGHNFLFSEPYQRLRRDLRDGVLGPADAVTVTWACELPQARHGPFEAWMLREPGNIAFEIGSHLASMILDLVGRPEGLRVRAASPIALPSGKPFYRRWRVDGACGAAAVDLLVSFAPGYTERTVHVRGSLASGEVDLDRNTYVLHRHLPLEEDLERHRAIREETRELRRQARRTLRAYVLSKLHLARRGTPYGAGIARAMDAFYAGLGGAMDARVGGELAVQGLRICAEMASAVSAGPALAAMRPPAVAEVPGPARTLVLGATGFIGQELVRQLAAAGRQVRIVARSPEKLPAELRTARVETMRGDLEEPADLERAMSGIDCVYHLARAQVKTWEDYQRREIDVTRRIAEAALAAGVRRFVYTGTIDSYYAGGRAGRITETTPLDPEISRRNYYARAKALSEQALLELLRSRGLPLVIFRPGIVIGRGTSPMHWGVGMWWSNAICQVWGEGRNPLPLVLVEDVASALVAAHDLPGLEGESFNLVADPCLTAQEYLDELDRAGGLRIQRQARPIARFYLRDLFRWAIKVAVRHPDRRVPSYRDWESRTQKATFDCTKAKERLGWRPVSDRAELVRRGIAEPLRDQLG